MKTKPTLTFLALAIGIILLSNCNSEANQKKTGFTMAVDSELTLLMRDMYNYHDSIKVDISKGSLSDEVKTFQDIHTAVATTPEKISNELYQGLASIYVNSAKRINRPNVNKIDAFNLMVDNCMSCHEQMCPGPMVKIKKLYLDKDLLSEETAK